MNFFEKIKDKINEKINPENIILIDNSHLHTKHKSFDLNKFHIKLIIKSEKLKKMNPKHSILTTSSLSQIKKLWLTNGLKKAFG